MEISIQRKVTKKNTEQTDEKMKKDYVQSFDFAANPSEVNDRYWITAIRLEGTYPAHTIKGGKWLIFANIDQIDEIWLKIKKATEEGKLGGSSKVATNKPNPNAVHQDEKVICVYTYDCTDEDDVMRIRKELRKLGITKKIRYKTDQATLEGKYSKHAEKTSVYYV
ncbi:MAG: putative phosphothreonine lyase domain-containing protein [Candidatus Heimdallarchaeaceae archaeon]